MYSENFGITIYSFFSLMKTFPLFCGRINVSLWNVLLSIIKIQTIKTALTYVNMNTYVGVSVLVSNYSCF